MFQSLFEPETIIHQNIFILVLRHKCIQSFRSITSPELSSNKLHKLWITNKSRYLPTHVQSHMSSHLSTKNDNKGIDAFNSSNNLNKKTVQSNILTYFKTKSRHTFPIAILDQSFQKI